MTKRMMLISVITVTVIIVAPAMAFREMRSGYGSGPGSVADIAADRDLNLTAEQRETIDTLREMHLKDIKPLQDQLHVKSRKLKDLWLAKTPDRENIMTLQREVQALRNQLMDKFTAYRLDAWQILTPEQKAKVRPFGPEHRKPRFHGPGVRGDHEHSRGMRESIPSPAGVLP